MVVLGYVILTSIICVFLGLLISSIKDTNIYLDDWQKKAKKFLNTYELMKKEKNLICENNRFTGLDILTNSTCEKCLKSLKNSCKNNIDKQEEFLCIFNNFIEGLNDTQQFIMKSIFIHFKTETDTFKKTGLKINDAKKEYKDALTKIYIMMTEKGV